MVDTADEPTEVVLGPGATGDLSRPGLTHKEKAAEEERETAVAPLEDQTALLREFGTFQGVDQHQDDIHPADDEVNPHDA